MKKKIVRKSSAMGTSADYEGVLTGIVDLLEAARRASARTVNALMTATYWEIGRRIVEHEQGGLADARYGDAVMARLSSDLTSRFGRGFSKRNLEQMRRFYLSWPIAQTASAQSSKPIATMLSAKNSASPSKSATEIAQMLSAQSPFLLAETYCRFPLPWSHYVLLIKVEKPDARQFYQAEALRNGWTVRQLDRQISTLFYERTLASRNKTAMLKKGTVTAPDELITPEQEIKDPLVLEFLGLKDEYSENELEEAIIHQLEGFLLELGGEFAFVGRQRRLRIGDEWYRIDLLFFHRRLRCLVVIDLKLGKFTHADAGQMHLYLNYAREHWAHDNENPPVGLILCAQKDATLAHYALEGLPNKVLATEYRTALPAEATLAAEVDRTRKLVESRTKIAHKKRGR